MAVNLVEAQIHLISQNCCLNISILYYFTRNNPFFNYNNVNYGIRRSEKPFFQHLKKASPDYCAQLGIWTPEKNKNSKFQLEAFSKLLSLPSIFSKIGDFSENKKMAISHFLGSALWVLVIIKMRKGPYLSPGASNKEKATFFSSTLKVEEKKVPLFFGLEAPRLR